MRECFANDSATCVQSQRHHMQEESAELGSKLTFEVGAVSHHQAAPKTAPTGIVILGSAFPLLMSISLQANARFVFGTYSQPCPSYKDVLTCVLLASICSGTFQSPSDIFASFERVSECAFNIICMPERVQC